MIRQQNGSFVFQGAITIETITPLLRESEPLFATEGDWALDFAAVEYVDSAAVSLLLEWMRQAAAHGRKLVARNLPDSLQCLLKVYDLQETIPLA